MVDFFCVIDQSIKKKVPPPLSVEKTCPVCKKTHSRRFETCSKTCTSQKTCPICEKIHHKQGECCGKECSQILQKKTNFEKYGVAHVLQNPKIREKGRVTIFKKYGVENPAQSSKIQGEMRKTNFKKYGVENVFQSSKIQEKIRKTNFKKYGCGHHSQSQEIQKKTRKTNFKKYGCAHPSQSFEILEKIKETTFKKYGVENPSQSEEIQGKIRKTKIQNGFEYDWSNFYHDPDLTITEMAKKNKIPYVSTQRYLFKNDLPYNKKINQKETEVFDFISEIYSGEIIRNDRTILKPKELDFYLPDLNLAFEFNGVYWHSENHQLGTKTHKECVQYHQEKTKECEEKGIRLIHIWEDQWNLKRDIIESIICFALGKPEETINAKDCFVEKISSKESMDFQRKTHIYSARGAQVHLGLKHQTTRELLALMVFGKSKLNKDYSWELLRYSPKLKTSIKGGPQKIWNHFLNEYKPRNVLCFSDASLFTGSLYENLGFKNQGLTAPNNWYLIDGIRKHKTNFTKPKMIKKGYPFDESLTVHQNMILHELCIWDCGSWKLVYEKS